MRFAIAIVSNSTSLPLALFVYTAAKCLRNARDAFRLFINCRKCRLRLIRVEFEWRGVLCLVLCAKCARRAFRLFSIYYAQMQLALRAMSFAFLSKRNCKCKAPFPLTLFVWEICCVRMVRAMRFAIAIVRHSTSLRLDHFVVAYTAAAKCIHCAFALSILICTQLLQL